MLVKLVLSTAGAAVLWAGGCRSLTDPGDIDEVYASQDGSQQVHRISWDATRRGTYIVVRPGSSPQFISEPPPDAALEAVLTLAANASVNAQGGGSGGVTVSSTETVQALARAVEVSFLRESMYRLGEAYVNGAISEGEYASRFDKIISATGLLIVSSHHRDSDDPEFKRDIVKAISRIIEQKKTELQRINQYIEEAEGLEAGNPALLDVRQHAIDLRGELVQEIQALESLLSGME